MDAPVKEVLGFVFTDGLRNIEATTGKRVNEIEVTLGFIASKFVLRLLDSGERKFSDASSTSRLVNGILFRYLATHPTNKASMVYRKHLGLSQNQINTLCLKFIEQKFDSEFESSSLKQTTFISLFISNLFKKTVDEQKISYHKILTQIDEIAPLLFQTDELRNNHATLLMEFGQHLEETDDLDAIYYLHNK